MSSLRLSKGYALLFALVLAVEVYIAACVEDRFVRPFVGDALAVVLLYALVRAVTSWPALPVLAGACAVAVAVEIAQYLDLLARLHLEHHALLRVIVGTQFDLRDLLAYGAGAVLVWLAEAARPPLRGV